MREVTRHQVGEDRIGQALADIEGRTFDRWHGLRYDTLSIKGLQEMGEELLDHVGAVTLEDPALESAPGRLALRTAAECSLGVLTLGAFPSGDFEVLFPLIDRELTSEDFDFGDAADQIPTTGTWVETFALGLVTGLLWDQDRMVGPMLKDDFAPELRPGQPSSPLNSASQRPGLAEMDALCCYLLVETSQSPGVPPVRKPEAEELVAAAARLDEAGVLSPDQRLLRILLDDDQPAFEQALTRRLLEHRDSVGPDPTPGSLLPVETITLAALAVHAHGWELSVRSGYLPAALLGGSSQM
ncbi:immunity 49 family protein [Streptomyces xanthochromogenes]|uniref:immunity 49 family protein n=1 Tax=Streptomyces xanthochromogenes TaxID=67384 RepID=UPI0037BA3560